MDTLILIYSLFFSTYLTSPRIAIKMNSNSRLINILVEIFLGILSGMLLEILLETLLYLLGIAFAAFFIGVSLFSMGFLSIEYLRYFIWLYSPFFLIKFISWWLLCWIFGKVGNYYFHLKRIHLLVAGLIGFYTLIYWTIFEISRYAMELPWGSPEIKSFWEELPKPPSYLIFESIYNQLIS